MTAFGDPQVSLILLPGTDRDATLGSVEAQSHTRWEIIEVSEHASFTDELAVALAGARGELVGFVTAGDRLHPDALQLADDAFGRDQAVDLVYTDEDEPGSSPENRDPFFKPDWSPDRLRSQNYVGRLALMRRSVLDEITDTRPHVEAAWEHDLILRFTERARRVEHIAQVCYHRATRSSEPSPEAIVAGQRAVEDHLIRRGCPATAVPIDGKRAFRLVPKLQEHPLVSIVIPTAGSVRRVFGKTIDLVSNCVESIMERSTYSNVEIVVVVDESTPTSTRERLRRSGGAKLRFVEFREPFNFSRKINLGVVQSTGEYLLILNDDTAVITPDWIESMLIHAVDSGVGAVGALLRFADRRFQHTGVVLLGGNPGHPYYGYPAELTGYHDNLLVPANHLAVTAACLMTRRSCFDEVGGFSTQFPANYNDVDFCLKLHQAGYRIVRAAATELYHFESSSRGQRPVGPEELALLHARWHSVVTSDPYYNPQFQPTVDYETR